MSRELAAALEGAKNRIRGMILRGVVKMITETTSLRTLQVSLRAGEPDGGVEHLEGYGLTARPGSGSECLAARVAGAADHPVILFAWSRADRPTDLAEWEVALYNRAGKEVRLTGTAVAVSGNIEADGDIDTPGTITGGVVSSGNGHTGTFVEPDTGKTLTFLDGICIGIV
jgi:phage gp45-like